MTSISGTGGGSSSLIQMLQQRFREADSDGDDKLSLDEFAAAGPQGAQGGGAKGPDQAELFAKLDSDGDGSVSKDEFTTAFSKFGSEAKSALLDAQELFANADADGDGSLSEDEFAAAAPKGPPPGGHGGPPPGPPPSGDSASVSDIFDELDADGDGSLSEDEFAAVADKSDTASASNDDDAQLLNLLKQASDLYASLTAKNAATSSVAVSA